MYTSLMTCSRGGKLVGELAPRQLYPNILTTAYYMLSRAAMFTWHVPHAQSASPRDAGIGDASCDTCTRRGARPRIPAPCTASRAADRPSWALDARSPTLIASPSHHGARTHADAHALWEDGMDGLPAPSFWGGVYHRI